MTVERTDLTEPLRYAQAVAALSCQVLGARSLAYEYEREKLDATVVNLQRANHHKRTSRPPSSVEIETIGNLYRLPGLSSDHSTR